MNSAYIDELGRNSIIQDLDKNLFVIAGAGSGKTSMLVSRMVMMVESGIDISKICAITFTKKAAAEFLYRFQSKLKERSTPPYKEGNKFPGDLPTPTDETAERCRKALKDIDLCFTGTIDSFCNLVLSEYPNNAGIPSSSAVVDEDELLKLCKKEYQNIANTDGSELKNKLEAFNELFSNGPEIFARSISDVMELSHLNIVRQKAVKNMHDAFNDLKAKYEKKVKNDVNVLLSKELDVTPGYEEKFEDFKRLSGLLKQDWTLNNFKNIKNKLKNSVKSLRFDDQPVLSLFEFKLMPRNNCYDCNDKAKAINEYYSDVNAFVYMYAMDFLVSVCEYIKQDLKKQGKISFTEYLMIFKDMVKKDMGEGMKLINHIRSKHSYFLIDESQDTSPAQTELFIYLCSQIATTKLEECQPIPGSLFIVGDPKQSIYGFRGADVGAYLRTKDLFDKVYDKNYNKVVYLTKNFRSTYELCNYFNSCFKSLPNFEPIPLDSIALPPNEIKDEVLSGLFTYPNYILAIKALVGKHYIFDRNVGKRLIDYKDIMLLTWSKSKHADIIKELNENDIPVFCEGKFYISRCEIVETIYAIFCYLADEEGQLLNLLASPLFNVPVYQLSGVLNVNDLPDGPNKDFILALDELRSIDNPVILLDTIIEKLKLYKVISFANLEYLLFVNEKFKAAYSNNEISDIHSASAFLKDLIGEPLERCINMEYVPNAVNLANVHKVKGLEKPIVILFESVLNADKPNKDSNYQNGEAYIFKTSLYRLQNLSLYDIDSGQQFETQIAIADEKKKQENDRLAYVAVTRARNVLVIMPASKSNTVWSYVRPKDATLPEIPYSSLPDPQVSYAGEFNFDVNVNFNLEETYWQKSPSKQVHAPSKLTEEVIEDTENNDVDSRTKGTVVHRLMQMIINSKGKLEKEKMIASILNEFGLINDYNYRHILEGVYFNLFNGGYPQVNGVPQDLLKLIDDAECYTEVPFAYKDGKKLWQGEIDLLFVKDNKYYIVDYKTNADDTTLDEEYQGQLEAYKEALRKTLKVEAEAFIYHIDT